MKILKIENTSAFQELNQKWNELLSRSSADHVFLTHEWLYRWWLTYQQGKKLLILLVEDKNRLVGIAPLYIEKILLFKLCPIRQLRFLGDQHVGSEFLDFIIERDREKEIIPTLLNYLAREVSWTRMFLDDTASNSSSMSLVLSQNHGFSSYASQKSICPFISLPESMDQFMQLPDQTFKKIVFRRTVSKLCKEEVVEFIPSVPEDQLDEYLEQLFSLHTQRWNGLGSFNHPLMREFYKKISSQLAPKESLRLSALKINKNVEVLEFGMQHDHTYYSLQGGVSEKGRALRAGNVLTYKIIESLIQKKAKTFHYLRGNESYKYQWGAQDTWTSKIELWRGKLGKILLLILKSLDRTKTIIKRKFYGKEILAFFKRRE